LKSRAGKSGGAEPGREWAAAALCAVGAERAVSNELKKLGLASVEAGFGRARFRADAEGLYRALIGLRAADRVMLEAGRFRAGSFDALFEGALAVPWEELVPPGIGVRVSKARSARSALSSQASAQAVAHKAVAQRLCRARSLARLPETGEDAEIRVYIERDEAALMLDLSGDPLFKRGYRKKGGAAPLRETAAAALLLLSGWKRKCPLYDPFCGSGTFLAEALMYAWDMAPGLGRGFALSRLQIADAEAEQRARSGLAAKINWERTIRIAGSDESPEAAALARAALAAVRETAMAAIRRCAAAGDPGSGESAAAAAGAIPESALPQVAAIPMREARPPPGFGASETEGAGAEGLLIANPPYGKRLGDRASAQRGYSEMAALAGPFRGWRLAAVTDHPGFESFFGRKADSRREISCGSGPSYFFQYGRL